MCFISPVLNKSMDDIGLFWINAVIGYHSISECNHHSSPVSSMFNSGVILIK